MAFDDDKKQDDSYLLRLIIANGDSGIFAQTADLGVAELYAIWAIRELQDGTSVNPIV